MKIYWFKGKKSQTYNLISQKECIFKRSFRFRKNERKVQSFFLCPLLSHRHSSERYIYCKGWTYIDTSWLSKVHTTVTFTGDVPSTTLDKNITTYIHHYHTKYFHSTKYFKLFCAWPVHSPITLFFLATQPQIFLFP